MTENKTMTIKHRRGLQKDLPLLNEAEIGFTTDEKRVFIGSNEGNIEIAKREKVLFLQDKLNELNEDIYDFGSVSNLTITQNLQGELFTLNWTNTDKTLNYQGVEVYAAEIDLSSKTYSQTVEDATRIYSGTGTTTSYVTKPNTTYYFKVYTKYNVFEKDKNDIGVSKYLKAIDTLAPSNVSDFKIASDNEKLTLSWKNSIDLDLKQIHVVYKKDAYPTNKLDGTVAYVGLDQSVVLSNLINGDTYYFTLFSEDNNGNVSEGIKLSAIPKDFSLYGVKIDTTNSNPETALTYIEQSTGFTPAKMNFTTDKFEYGSWEDKFPFNQIKPCLVLNGTVVGYLNPNDYTKFVNGTTADITSGSVGDVMIEFPKVYWKFETVGNDLYIRYSDKQIDSSYKCLAHQRGTTVKDKIYISAYLGYNLSSKLRSLSGKIPTASQTISQFRTLAQANGANYDQMAYCQLLMLQVLYIVMFKNRDSQTALGRGYVDGNSAATTTGNLNTKGMFYGETTGKVQMKFCGIEDFYGNLFYFIDGIATDASYKILINNSSFNDTGSGYTTSIASGLSANTGGYIAFVQGGTETGFIVKTANGSATTYYADYGLLNASRIASFGGSWVYSSGAGAFGLRLNGSASSTSAIIGARLMLC